MATSVGTAKDLLRLWREQADYPTARLPLFVATFLHPESMQKAMDGAVSRAKSRVNSELAAKATFQEWTPWHFNLAIRHANAYRDFEPKAGLLVEQWKLFQNTVADNMETQLFSAIEENMSRSTALRRSVSEPFESGIPTLKGRPVRHGHTGLAPFHAGHGGGFSFGDWMKWVDMARKGKGSEIGEKGWVFH